MTYSDNTPGLTNSYDRRGRLGQVKQGTNSYTILACNDAGQPLSAANSGGVLNGLSLTNGYDQFLRRTNLVALSGTTQLVQDVFGYDNAARLQAMSAGTASAGYSYLANSPLVEQIHFTNSGVRRMTTTRQYDYLDRLQSIASTPSAGPTLSFGYLYNPANQRINAALADNSYWVYQYDILGQVTSGKRHWSDAKPVAGQQFQYQFDDLGNRVSTDSGGDTSGGSLRHAGYYLDAAHRALNQYSSRDVPGYVQSVGTAAAGATVSLWTTNRGYAIAARQGTYFRAELAINNTNAAAWVAQTNVAVLPGGGTGGADVVVTDARTNYLPRTPEQFTYDGDGSLTSDGRWTYTWDAENRLVSVTNNNTVAPAVGLKFEYDWRGRRIHKQVWSQGSLTKDILFLYDLPSGALAQGGGWNPIGELNASDRTVLRTYMWGLDLSGSERAAGGVGGLLELNDTANGAHFVAFDGNGNVAGLVRAGDGSSAALYDYGPFGEPLRATGPMAKANPFRFTTKYQDDETDLLYYGYRYYSASMGRWVSRDPIGEAGGINLYEFVGNNPVSRWDPYGLDFHSGVSASGVLMPGPFGYFSGDTTLENLAAGLANSVPEVGNLLSWFGSGINAALDSLNRVQDEAIFAADRAIGGSEQEAADAAQVAGVLFFFAGGEGKEAGKLSGAVARALKCKKATQRTAAENRKARDLFKNKKDAARQAWEQRTGQTWPKDANGRPWPAEHTPPLKEGGDPMTVTPRDPGAADPHNIPGPDGLTDYQRWGALGTPAREAKK